MRTLSSILCLSAALMAQNSVIFPSDHTNIANGESSINWFPFSHAAPFRAQIVYEDWDLGIAPGTPITRIGFRQDGTVTSASHEVMLEVSMGVSNGTSETLCSSFASNFAGPPTVVRPQSLFVVPALTGTEPIAWIDLPAPHYVYQGGDLLVEFCVASNDNGNAAWDYRLDMANYVSTVTAGVPGCLHTGGQRPTLQSSPGRVGGNWDIELSNAPVNVPIAIFISPGQQMVAPYGLGTLALDPSCMGQLPQNDFISFGGVSDVNGGASWSVPIPNWLIFNDAYMTSQVVACDMFSTGQLVVSNADEVQFGIDPASTILIGMGSTNLVFGDLYPHYGVVTLFN